MLARHLTASSRGLGFRVLGFRVATRYRFKTVSCGGRKRSNNKRLPPTPRLFHHSRLPPTTRPLPLHDSSILHDYLRLGDSAMDIATGIAPHHDDSAMEIPSYMTLSLLSHTRYRFKTVSCGVGFALQRANSRMLRNADRRRRTARGCGLYSSGTRPSSSDDDY